MIHVLSNILFFIGLSFIFIFLYSLFKLGNRLAGLFSAMCLCIAIYVIGYGFELQSENILQIKFFLKMEYFGNPFMTVFGFMFSYKFYFNKNPSAKINIMVLVIPILTLFFTATNEYHHLFYADVSAIQYDGFLIANLSKGPWYCVHIIYSYLLLILGSFSFYKVWQDSQYKQRTLAFWMFFGSLWPAAAFLIYIAGFSPYGMDLTPFGFSMQAVSYYIALFRFDYLELKEIIRSVVFIEIKEGIFVTDDRNRLIDFNNAGQEIFEWLDTKHIGRTLSDFEDGRKIMEHSSGLFEMEIVKGGVGRYYEFRITALKERKKHLGNVYIIRDITEQKEIIKELNYMASFDPLTQVYNRRRLIEEAEKELLRAKRYNGQLSVLMIDIDYFKNINDQYGHLAGDEVIKSVIGVFKSRLRTTDIIGRYGGEEFLIILPQTTHKNAIRIAEYIRKHVADCEVTFSEKKIQVTVSIGIASVTSIKNVTDIHQIINRADSALYHAKNNGRNQTSGCIL